MFEFEVSYKTQTIFILDIFFYLVVKSIYSLLHNKTSSVKL